MTASATFLQRGPKEARGSEQKDSSHSHDLGPQWPNVCGCAMFILANKIRESWVTLRARHLRLSFPPSKGHRGRAEDKWVRLKTVVFIAAIVITYVGISPNTWLMVIAKDDHSMGEVGCFPGLQNSAGHYSIRKIWRVLRRGLLPAGKHGKQRQAAHFCISVYPLLVFSQVIHFKQKSQKV